MILRLSLYQLLHLDSGSGVGGRRRCRGLDARRRRQAAARPASSTPCCASTVAAAAPAAAAAAPGRPDAIAQAALAYLGDHALASRMAGRRAGSIATASTRAERWVQFNNEPPPLTLRVNRLRTTRDDAATRLSRVTVSRPSRRRSRRTGCVVERQSAARQAGTAGSRAGRSLAARAARGRRPTGRARARSCASPGGKTTAMAARHGRSRRARRVRRPATPRRAASRHRPQAGARSCRIVQRAGASEPAFLQPTSIGCSWMRRARGWAPCDATPTSGGGGRKRSGGPRRRQLALLRRAPTSSHRADGSSTPRVRASRRRTRRSSIASSLQSPGFDCSIWRHDGARTLPRFSTRAGCSARCRSLIGLEAFFAAALRAQPDSLRQVQLMFIPLVPRLEPRQVSRPGGRSWRHFPGVFRRSDASGAAGQRRAGAVAGRPHRERGDAGARRPRPGAACRGQRAVPTTKSRRADHAAGTGRRRPAGVSGRARLDQLRAQRTHRAAARRADRTHRAHRLEQGRRRVDRCPSSDPRDYPADVVVAQDPAGRIARAEGFAPAQSR